MGPSILFDKSAIQSLGQQAIREVSRYFYTVVPPVLLTEALADLSLQADDLEATKRKVAEIAGKLLPIDSIANAHFQPMCVHNLLGDPIPMDRRPAVAGGRAVTGDDPPLPRHGLLQAPPVDVQETANLLAILQREAAGLPVPRLPAPLPRGHPGQDAHRVRHPTP